MRKLGAPKGGRVDWLLLFLPRIVQDHYTIDYRFGEGKYDTNYYLRFCTPKGQQERYDEYIIIRTSQKCYQVTYYDKPTKIAERVNCRKAIDVIDFIQSHMQSKLEQEDMYRLSRYEKIYNVEKNKKR